MSQEAEYYLRNLSYGEARDLARRIAGQERAAAERWAQDLVASESRRLEGRLRGEISGLRHEVVRRQQHLQRQLDCNQRLVTALQERSEMHGAALAEHRQALAVLAAHDREITRQIEENGRLIDGLALQLQSTERRLQAEIAERRSERERHASNAAMQRSLAVALIEGLPTARFESVGLGPDLSALRRSLNRGLATAAQPGNEQAALALLVEIQNKAEGLLVEADRREGEIGLRKESARLALELARTRLKQVTDDKDVATVFARHLGSAETRLAQATETVRDLEGTSGIEFTRLLARWDNAVQQCRAIQDELEGLWNDRDRVLDLVRQRNRTVKALIGSLMDVWGADFELDHMFAITDDPSSTLMIQTKRPHGPNATVYLDLDGRMQVSFTGYVGMECAKDLAEFQQRLEKAGGLKMERGAIRDEPDKPNPPGLGDGSGPLVYRPPSKAHDQSQSSTKR